jgi:hypothetical protein
MFPESAAGLGGSRIQRLPRCTKPYSPSRHSAPDYILLEPAQLSIRTCQSGLVSCRDVNHWAVDGESTNLALGYRRDLNHPALDCSKPSQGDHHVDNEAVPPTRLDCSSNIHLYETVWGRNKMV